MFKRITVKFVPPHIIFEVVDDDVPDFVAPMTYSCESLAEAKSFVHFSQRKGDITAPVHDSLLRDIYRMELGLQPPINIKRLESITVKTDGDRIFFTSRRSGYEKEPCGMFANQADARDFVETLLATGRITTYLRDSLISTIDKLNVGTDPVTVHPNDIRPENTNTILSVSEHPDSVKVARDSEVVTLEAIIAQLRDKVRMLEKQQEINLRYIWEQKYDK